MPNFTEEEFNTLVERVFSLEATLEGLDNESLTDVVENSDSSTWLFVLISAFDIFLMQAGFALLEVGTVQAKNAKSILFKNTLDMATSMIIWWLVGFGLAGGGASGQEGRSFCYIEDHNTLSFVHSYVFAGTTATIVSGGVAERMNFAAYLLFSVVMVGLVYPALVAWAWAPGGFLARLGYLDFAGSGLIHLCGGAAALLGAALVGPRFGRFKEVNGAIEVIELKGHSPILSNFGTFILLFGWLSFNGSSILAGGTTDLMVAARAVCNTLLSVAAAGIASFVDSLRPQPGGAPHTHDLAVLNNAMLAGAVGITAACPFVEGWAALIIGVVAFYLFKHFNTFIVSLKIDDPLEASGVHGACGLWGVLAVGLFAHPRLTDGTRGAAGLFVGGNGRLLGVQLLGAAVVLAWTGAVALVAYKLIDRLPGCQLRVDKDAELLGLDFAYHDGFAYPELNKEAVAHFNEVKAAERRVKARNAGVKATRRQVKVRSVASSKGSSKGSVKSSKRKGVSILVRKGTKTMCKDGPNSDEERSMSCSVSSYTQQGLLGSSVSMSPMTTGSKMDYSNKTVLSERNAKLTKAGSSSRTLAEIAPKSTGPQGGEVSDHALFGNKAVQSPHGLQDDVFKSSVLGKGEARELALRELTDKRGTSRRWGEKGASSSRGATARNRVVVEDVDDREGEEGGVSSPSGSPAARSREQPLGKQ